jgi:hypothetical protein
MSDDTSHYPTIMKLRTFESANKLLIKAYDTGHKTYLRDIKNKDFESAQSNLDSLNQVNTQLVNNLNSIKALLKKGISEGSVMQDIAAASIPILNNTYKRASRQNNIINKLNNQIKNIDGELQTSQLEQQSYQIQLVILFIVGIIIIYITIKSFLTQDSGMLENIILAICFGLLVYYIIKKVF